MIANLFSILLKRTYLGNLLLFGLQVVSDSLQPRGLQHTRLPCPPLSPRVCKFMSIEIVMPSNHLIFCHPLLLLPSIFASIRVYSSESCSSLQPRGLQHTRLPCPPLSPRICPSSCPWNQRCHPTISSSAAPFFVFNLTQHQGLFQ